MTLNVNTACTLAYRYYN